MASNFNLVRGALKRNPHHQRNGLKSYVHAMKKWNFTPTIEGPYCAVQQVHQQGQQAIFKLTGKKIGGRAHVKGHVLAKKDPTSGQTGEVPAEDVENNAEYLATVGIGTPAQNLALDFDTGSADLWVWSTELSSSVKQAGSSHTIFDASKSSTFKKSSASTWQIQYGDGSTASGTVGTDNVNAGGLIVTNQAIELADTLSTQFAQGPGDGLLGLAFGSINTVQPKAVNTLVENMIAEDSIKKNSELFTAFLGSTPPASATTGSSSGSSGSSSSAAESFYTFGYIDQDATNGQTPAYTAVDNSQGFWMFDSASAKVGSQTVTRSGNTAIADTGTTLALVGDDLCQAVYSAIPGAKQNTQQQGWVFPTSTDLSSIPQIQVAVGDALFTINPEELPFQDLGDGTYYGGIQSRGDQGFDILGDVFLRSVYAIFDQGNLRFGCTQRASTATSSSS
ncbi:related to pepsin precursor [Lecanosticta acicola]|uniref:Related to pepsin n=1 Tax=Lecanosticta acicola TaxID=111012 RepID=A0AAI8YSE7_9PEZI|nr:related to pepsin precursor [Lecanosticta acicola]